jgi:hypothetical protein
MSYNTGVQKGLSKLNQQFNEILVSNARINNLNGFPNSDFNIESNNSSIILNKNTKIDNNGILDVGDKIKINNLELNVDGNDLIWNNDVIITDSSLELELDNLGIDKKKLLPIGSIIQYPKNAKKIPTGWKLCNGETLNKTIYPHLTDILDETFDSEHFILPDIENDNTPISYIIFIGY